MSDDIPLECGETNHEIINVKEEVSVTEKNSITNEMSTRTRHEPRSKDEAKKQALCTAIKTRDLSSVKQLLADGVSLTCRDKLYMTPLQICMLHYCYHNYHHNVLTVTKCRYHEEQIRREILATAVKTGNIKMVLDSKDSGGRTPLSMAIEVGCLRVIQDLLNNGARVDYLTDKNESVLHVSVQRPYILEYFLNHNIGTIDIVDINGYTAMHTAARFNVVESMKLLLKKFGNKLYDCRTFDESTVLHVAAEHGSHEAVKFLLRVPYRSKFHVDRNGETPLNKAIKQGHKVVTALLLSHGAVLSDKGYLGMTAVEQITRKFPNPAKFFEDVFDECITEKHSSSKGKETKVLVNYKVLANSDGRGISQIKVIEELVRCGQRHLLIHPLIESLLYLKWRCFLPLVYTIMTIYAIFLASFNAFLVTMFYKRDYCNSSSSKTPKNETDMEGYVCFDIWNWICILFMYLSIFIIIVQECVFLYLKRRRYFMRKESWVKICLLALATIVPLLSISCSEPPGWLRHAACVALLLSWLQAMLLLSRFPDWGYYVLMLERVAFNVFKILLTSICLIIGFSFCFMIEYHSESPFEGPAAAFVKVLVMMLSEFDYENLFGEQHVTELRSTKTVVRLLFVIFVIFIAIVLMNFMIGVAVSDINNLNVIGNIRRLEKQVELQSTLDALANLQLMKIFRKLSRVKYHHYIFKDVETDEKWKVWFKINDYSADIYEQDLTAEVHNAIINAARTKIQRKYYDIIKNEKKKKLNAVYNTLVGTSEQPNSDKQANSFNFLDELRLNKKMDSSELSLREKLNEIEDSNNEMKKSIEELIVGVNEILAIVSRNLRGSSIKIRDIKRNSKM